MFCILFDFNMTLTIYLFKQDEEIEELSNKPDSQEGNEKRKLSTESNVSAKKIVLNRKPVIEEIKNEQTEKIEIDTKTIETAPPEKKIIKLSELGIKEVIFSFYYILQNYRDQI